jgi:putative FmdB family regulatory protein
LPTYEYACTACGHRLEAVQKFTDEPLSVCPDCGGALRKVYGAVGIVLKGSGFYKTDTRASNGKGKHTSGAKESGDSGSTSSDGAGSSKESTSTSSSDSSSSSSKDTAPAASAAPATS